MNTRRWGRARYSNNQGSLGRVKGISEESKEWSTELNTNKYNSKYLFISYNDNYKQNG